MDDNAISGTGTNTKRDEDNRIVRGAAAKKALMRMAGYPNGRPRYAVDHIVPLACGGKDEATNMQWQTLGQAQAEDKVELAGCKPQ